MVGRTVGKYRIVEQIGRGGMGTVYRAIDETLDRHVAIKVLNADLIEQDAVERFRREAMTLARLNHPRIGAIHELTRDGHDLLMVMEFIAGETFEKLIERAAPLPIPQAVTLCAQILDGLQYAHGAGVVHRDLKPANVIVTPNGDVKIMDFGIARVQGSEHLTSHGFMVGTPAYMAPEQVRGEEVDPRMDLYSIAVVLYRLLTHHLPFQGDTAVAMIHSQLSNPPTPPRQFRADLPDWLVAALDRGLAKAPVERFQTAAEFRTALDNGLTGKMRVPAVPVPGDFEATIGPMLTPPSMRVPIVPPGVGTSRQVAAPSGAPSGAAALPSPVPARPPEATVTLRAPHLATAAVLLVVLVTGIAVLAFVALRRPATLVVPAATTDQANAAAQPSTPPPSPAPAAAATATGGAAPAGAPAAGDGTAATRPTPRGGPAAVASAPAARRGGATPATGTPAAPVAAAPTTARDASAPGGAPAGGTPADVPAEHFADVRTIVVDGTRSREVDALLSLEAASLVVRTRSDGTLLRTLPYRTIAAATYARARRPRGQTIPGALEVPENFGGSGFLGSAKHWLTLQTSGEFLVIRLEDRNVIRVLNSVEARTGLKVQRNQGG